MVHGIMSVERLTTAAERPHVTCIPVGTGSDFARGMNMNNDWPTVLGKIGRWESHLVDVCMLQCESLPAGAAQESRGGPLS